MCERRWAQALSKPSSWTNPQETALNSREEFHLDKRITFLIIRPAKYWGWGKSKCMFKHYFVKIILRRKNVCSMFLESGRRNR